MQTRPLSQDVPMRSFLSHNEFLTEHGDVGTVMVTSPKDVECSEQSDINGIAERLTKAWRILDPRFRVYQHWVRRKNERGLYVDKTYLTVVNVNGEWSDTPSIFPFRLWSRSREGLDLRRAALSQKVKAWQEQCSDFWPMRFASKQEAFELFWGMLNLQGDAPRLLGDLNLNRQVATSEISWEPTMVGERYASALSLQYVPEEKITTPYMLEPLASIEAEFNLCVQSQGAPILKQQRAIKHAKSSQSELEKGIGGYLKEHESGKPTEKRMLDQAALANSEALSAVQREVSEGNRLCLFSLSVVVHADSPLELEHSAESVKSALDVSVRMVREGIRRKIVFFSMCPGHHDLAHYREKKISEASLADFSVVFGTDSGRAYSKHLGSPAIVVLETQQHTEYHFNLHVAEDDDVGHWLILGKTGSGKTVLSKKLIHSAQKYRPYTSITDFAGTYKHLTQICGGSYTRVEIGSDAARMSPLAFPESKEQLDLATSLVALLVEQGKTQLDTDQVEDIYRGALKFYASNEPRRLGALVRFLPEEYGRPLRRWVEPGQFAWLLDNEESLANENDFQTHEFVGMDDADHKALLEPMFMGKFHMDSMRVRDPKRLSQLKILWFDEAWVAAQSVRGLDYLRGGLKMARQYNAVVGLSTQSPKDASNSPIWPVVNQCCNKIMLADPEMTAAEYADTFGLQPRQIETVKGLAAKRELFVRTAGERGKVLILNLTDDERLLYATDSPTVARRNDAIEVYGDDWLVHMRAGGSGNCKGEGQAHGGELVGPRKGANGHR